MWKLLLTGALLTGTVDVEVATLDGHVQRGRLLELNQQQLILESGSDRLDLPADQLRSIVPLGTPTPPTALASARVRLRDGSTLLAKRFVVADGAVQISLASGKSATTDAKTISYVRYSAATPSLDKQWQEILSAKSAGDVLVIRRQQDSLDYLEGVLGDISEEIFKFEFEGETIDVRRAKVDGVIYYHATAGEFADPTCKVTTVDGSVWHARSITSAADELRIETVGKVQGAVSLDAVRRVDFSTDTFEYLSDLKPITLRWTPFVSPGPVSEQLSQMYLPRRDASFAGGKLRLRYREGKSRVEEFDKGLAIHSRTETAYRLAGKYRRFSAIVGIDERAGESGQVRLSISADDKLLWDELVSGEDDPQELDLDVSGARRLTILVDFADGLDIADHLNLCNAGLTK